MLLSLGGELASSSVAGANALAPAPVEYSAEVSVASTSVSVSVLPSAPSLHEAAIEAASLSLRRIAANRDPNFSIVARPAIFLRDQDGNILSSLDGPTSTDSSYAGSAPNFEGDTAPPDDGSLSEQAKELTPEGLALLPKVPWALNSSIKGSLSSDQGWMSFKVPVGPHTTSLRLAVRPEFEDGSSATVMVDQMYLIGANGVLMASVAGAATISSSSRQTLYVTLHSAPAGGTLVIRLVQPFTQPPAASTGSTDSTDSTDSSAPADSTNGLGAITPSSFPSPNGFTVDIQRDDALPQGPGATAPSTVVVIPPVSYLPTSPGTAQFHMGNGPASSSLSLGTVNFEQGYASNMSNRLAKVADARDSTDSSDVESESTPISLGPLVSRGSAPIGPALATSIDDPAPSISRDGQGGRDSTLERLEGEDAELVLRLRLEGDSNRTAGRRLDPQDVATADEDLSPLKALKGLGGLPLMVASFHRQRTPALADLAATLRQHADQAASLIPVDEGLAISSIERRGKGDEIAKAGIATRAVGFIIALGLASGPLYPDLVALARRKLSCKRRGGSPVATATKRRLFHRRSVWPVS